MYDNLKSPGRNDECWCGSGRKYKKCHLDFDERLQSLYEQGFEVPQRSLLKTPEEIEGIKRSAAINIGVLDLVAERIGAGVSTEEIDKWIYDYTVEHGGIPADLDYEGYPKSVCTSINEVVCHGIPSPDDVLKDGDIVNIDYKGTKDGEAFDGGTAEGQDLTLGSGSMIDGFEDGLVGAKKGETKTLDLTFPENYREESLAGQAVVFEVTVNAVKEKQDAVLDDAFVQRTSDYQTVDEYKEGIRADLLAQKQKTAEQEMEQDVLQDIIDNSDFKFSRNGLSVRYNQMLKQYTNQAKMYGMTLSQMAQANGMDEAGFKEYIYSSVKEAAKKEIVVKDIAAKEGLDNLTDEDKEAFAQANGTSKDTLVSLYGEDTVNEQVLQDKVLRFLASNADNEAENPAKLYGVYPQKGVIAPGSDADIVLIDPKKESTISAATHAYNTDNNPFEGFELKCGIDKVFLRGNLAVDDGKLVQEKLGKYIFRGKKQI